MRHLIRQEDMALMRGGQREPSVAFASRISVDADQMRRRLEAIEYQRLEAHRARPDGVGTRAESGRAARRVMTRTRTTN